MKGKERVRSESVSFLSKQYISWTGLKGDSSKLFVKLIFKQVFMKP